MSNYKYVSINRIFSKFIRDVGVDFNEGDLIEWAGEALEFIGAERYYAPAIAFIEVKNHQCAVPLLAHDIKQIARDTQWSKADDALCPATIIAATINNTDESPSIPVALDCNGEPLNAYDLAYYRPYFDLKWEHSFWYGSGYYRNRYAPVRKNTSTFFGIDFDCNDKTNCEGNDTYDIVQGTVLRFSFREGFVAVAYDRQITDDKGYPMIPDNISYTTAITKYVTMKMFEKDYYKGREGAKGKMDDAEQKWQWYCKQAGNADMMPQGVDEHQNLLDQRSHILPKQNDYYSYFGNMANPEARVWNRGNRRTY